MHRVFTLDMKEIQGNPASSSARNSAAVQVKVEDRDSDIDLRSPLSSAGAPSSRAGAAAEVGDDILSRPLSEAKRGNSDVGIPIRVMGDETRSNGHNMHNLQLSAQQRQYMQELAKFYGQPLPVLPGITAFPSPINIGPDVTAPSLEADPSVVRYFQREEQSPEVDDMFDKYIESDALEPAAQPQIIDAYRYPNPALLCGEIPGPDAVFYTSPVVESELPLDHPLYKLMFEQSRVFKREENPVQQNSQPSSTEEMPPPPTPLDVSMRDSFTPPPIQTRGTSIPYDAPTQPRNYVMPSVTARKHTNDQTAIERRRSNTLAARRSREKKRQREAALVAKKERVQAERNMWMKRALFLEREMSLKGLEVPAREPGLVADSEL